VAQEHFRRVLKELDVRGIEPAFKRKQIGARFYVRAQLHSSLTEESASDSDG
jgi:hypothetical protein